jgi:hypothetical protein
MERSCHYPPIMGHKMRAVRHGDRRVRDRALRDDSHNDLEKIVEIFKMIHYLGFANCYDPTKPIFAFKIGNTSNARVHQVVRS